jgi:hypothetical protein
VASILRVADYMRKQYLCKTRQQLTMQCQSGNCLMMDFKGNDLVLKDKQKCQQEALILY